MRPEKPFVSAGEQRVESPHMPSPTDSAEYDKKRWFTVNTRVESQADTSMIDVMNSDGMFSIRTYLEGETLRAVGREVHPDQ